LHLCGSTELRNEILYNDLKFSFMRDTAPVASLVLAPLVLVVHPSFSARSVPELIAAAKANPDALTVASPGVGSAPHVSWELFRSMTGTRMLHVPYRGGAPALAMNFPNSAGEPARTVSPQSAMVCLILGSARPALMALLSTSMIASGVSLGRQRLPSRLIHNQVQIRLWSEHPAAVVRAPCRLPQAHAICPL
jgi:Tripartite tricarboxylate transporter family receptor